MTHYALVILCLAQLPCKGAAIVYADDGQSLKECASKLHDDETHRSFCVPTYVDGDTATSPEIHP